MAKSMESAYFVRGSCGGRQESHGGKGGADNGGMTQVVSLVLSNGGLGSLVATAWALAQARQEAGQARGRLALLHLAGTDAAAGQRWEHVQRQANHFEIKDVVRLQPVAVGGGDEESRGSASPPRDEGHRALTVPRLLVEGMARTLLCGAGSLVWPVHCGDDLDLAARATQQAMLIEQLAQLEAADDETVALGHAPSMATSPAIAMPLLELTDRQMVELGANLGVPWELAWSCGQRGMKPCGGCPGCRRRATAFAEARMMDPQWERARE